MTPFFSVIVPVFRQWHLVPSLLDRLAAQSLPEAAFEIILVDNELGSGAETLALPTNARVIQCAQPGSYAARNAGVQVAKGRWLTFTDADCLPLRDWLSELRKAAGLHVEQAILAGDIRMKARTASPNPYEIYDLVKGIRQRRYVCRGYGATANLAMPTSLFRETGGFDRSRLSGGDADFCQRAGRKGARIIFVRAAVVEHPARCSWQALATKSRRLKGGHLRSGSLGRRVLWMFRTISPPLAGVWRLASYGDHPASYRLTAIAIHFRLWLTELRELARLALGAQAERS